MAKILVIEDEDGIRLEVIDWLTFEGHEVFSAANGREGVDVARSCIPDLILSDITMPELDGYGVLMAIHQQQDLASIPFIFLTARADKSFMRHGMELGADDYLTKPFSRAELLSAINARIERVQSIKLGTREEINALKSKILRVVGHELKTPLLSVTLVQEVIEHQLGQLSGDEMADLLQTMRAGTDRLQHVVQQILYLTQIEGGALSVESIEKSGSAVFVNQLIVSAIDMARGFAYRNQRGQIYQDAQNSDVTVWGNVDLLRHALAELLSNALAFSSEGKAIVIREWKVGDYVWIGIMDQGHGMSDADGARAQLAFEQIQRETHEQQGLGIGLTVAQQIIRIHGGEVRIESVIGEGTQVLVRLPLRHDA